MNCPARTARPITIRRRAPLTSYWRPPAGQAPTRGDSTRTGHSAPLSHGEHAIDMKLILGDLISYRNSGKGCTRALIGSNEP
jgi:hypothetical protein